MIDVHPESIEFLFFILPDHLPWRDLIEEIEITIPKHPKHYTYRQLPKHIAKHDVAIYCMSELDAIAGEWRFPFKKMKRKSWSEKEHHIQLRSNRILRMYSAVDIRDQIPESKRNLFVQLREVRNCGDVTYAMPKDGRKKHWRINPEKYPWQNDTKQEGK